MFGLAPVFTLADERIPDGVSVGAVSLSGLTEEEAEKQIESYVNEKLNQDITLVVNGTEAKSDAQTLGVAWDNRDEVAKAIQGTELKGNLVKRYMKKKDLEVNPVKIELDLSVDQDKVSTFVSEKCGSAVADAVDATITRKGGKFEITPSKEGLTVDMDATKAALNDALNSEDTDAIRVEASVTVKKAEGDRGRSHDDQGCPRNVLHELCDQRCIPFHKPCGGLLERSTDMC